MTLSPLWLRATSHKKTKKMLELLTCTAPNYPSIIQLSSSRRIRFIPFLPVARLPSRCPRMRYMYSTMINVHPHDIHPLECLNFCAARTLPQTKGKKAKNKKQEICLMCVIQRQSWPLSTAKSKIENFNYWYNTIITAIRKQPQNEVFDAEKTLLHVSTVQYLFCNNILNAGGNFVMLSSFQNSRVACTNFGSMRRCQHPSINVGYYYIKDHNVIMYLRGIQNQSWNGRDLNN